MELYLIDALGPFFQRAPQKRLNWSKVRFGDLERGDDVSHAAMAEVRQELERFCSRVAALGFNAITLDDLAHLANWTGYRPQRRRLIARYREEWARLFGIAERHGLRVFVNTDVMFFTPELEHVLGRSTKRIANFLAAAIDELLGSFPQIAGIVLRFGECDGTDVDHDDLRSRLVVRSPRQMRVLLRTLLPVFERRDRLLVARTWSVGAHHIGDLMWNRDTFLATFGGIHSEHLVLSMKYGESDFFRFLPLNRHFALTNHRKIVELQARREYEGFGEFPSFVGWEYQRYRDELRAVPGIVGFSVWCQTGGWTRFRRLSYLEPAAYWNELNTEVTFDLFARGLSVEDAVARFCARRGDPARAAPLLELLRCSDEAVLGLLYVPEIARQKLFFRRLRLPPLLSVFWDNMLINHGMRQFLRALVADGEARCADGEHALAAIRRMIELAPAAGAPVADLEFELDTFTLLAAARRYYFGEYGPAVRTELLDLRDRYRARYPQRHYAVHLDFRPLRLRSAHVRRILLLLVRRQRGYRLVDRLVTVKLLGLLYHALGPLARRMVPSEVRRSAMGIETVLR